MPRYEVTVQGRGIAIRIEGSVAVGFLRIVQVSATDPVDAQEQAVEIVKSEWELGPRARSNRGALPYLTIDAIGILSWRQRLLGAPKGYIFFAEDGVRAPADQRLERP